MRVALFTDTFLPQINGVTNMLSKLIQYFDKSSIEYMIFAPDSYTELNQSFKIEKFPSMKFFLYPECRLSFPNIFRIKNTLLNFKPDIIHLITEFNMGITGLILGKKLGVPTISNYTTNFAQYLKYYNMEMLQGTAWGYMKWFHNQSDLALCPSLDTKFLLKNQGILKVEIYSRGIDSECFNHKFRNIELRKKLGINDKIVLLYVGRVAPEKAIDILLKSYNKLKDKYKGEVALIITGAGPDLQKYKREFPKDTIFTGYKKGQELAEIYASSDIFVFPSPTETFGNVVLEAMASGLPVVVPNTGGVKEIVQHRVNGLLFNAGDSLELTDSIIKIIDDRELRNYLLERSKETVLQRSWNVIFEELISIYNRVTLEKQQECKAIS